jgi:hypothetical protein
MDIELQTLIEQDIDLGIKNNFFYQIESQQKNNQDMSYQFNSDFIKMKNSFQSQFEESQKVNLIKIEENLPQFMTN